MYSAFQEMASKRASVVTLTVQLLSQIKFSYFLLENTFDKFWKQVVLWSISCKVENCKKLKNREQVTYYEA